MTRRDPPNGAAGAKPTLKVTPRQAEVMANLTQITTDGCRHDPMFWLGAKNVSVQVRSLRAFGHIALQDGRLIKAEPAVDSRPPAPDIRAAVDAMRELFAGDAGPELARERRATTKI